jgi:hypothetical protein
MKTVHTSEIRSGIIVRHLARILSFGGAAMMMMAGCASTPSHDSASVSGGKPKNVYTPAVVFPQNVKRLAVLPVCIDDGNASLSDGRDALEPVLNEELVKTGKFEIVRISSEQMRSCSGRNSWSGEEVLPNDLLASLRDATGCDAVIFSRLTLFRAYPPLAVGWRMKIVDVRSQQVLWAGDVAFDDGKKKKSELENKSAFSVSNWYSGDFSIEPGPENSPRNFGRQAVARLFSTLPQTVAELFSASGGGNNF